MAQPLVSPSAPTPADGLSTAAMLTVPIERYLQGSVAAAEAAREILALFYQDVEVLAAAGRPADHVELPLSNLWWCILDLAVRSPAAPGEQQQQHHHHDARPNQDAEGLGQPSPETAYAQPLADLLSVIKRQSVPAHLSPEATALLRGFEREWGQSFWTDLPVLGMAVHDTEVRNPRFGDDEPGVYSAPEWARLLAFYQLVKDRGVMDFRIPDGNP